MFDWVLNTPLLWSIFLYIQILTKNMIVVAKETYCSRENKM